MLSDLITLSQTWMDENGPMMGSLPPSVCGSLIDVLRTTTPRHVTCWCCLWAGFELDLLPPVLGKIRGSEGEYQLCRGPLDQAMHLVADPWFLSPSMWWPEDKEWFVATPIESLSSYVGCAEDLYDEMIGAPSLETVTVSPLTLIDSGIRPLRAN